MLIYIIPKKIPKARFQVLNNLAQRKGFPMTEKFSNSVTHVVTSYDSREKAFSAIERQPAENVEILSLDWLTDCTTAGKIVDVTDKVRVQGSATTAISKEETFRADLENKDASKDGESCEYQDTKFVCQRVTPLNHHNTKFTDIGEKKGSEEREEIFGKRGCKEPEEIFGKKGCESSDDSDYEDDALTEEEFKDSEGYKLTMKCLDAMLGKPLT